MLRREQGVRAAIGADLAVDDEHGARRGSRVDPDVRTHAVRREVREQEASARVVSHPSGDGSFGSERRGRAGGIEGRSTGSEGDVRLMARTLSGHVDHQVADGDEPDHASLTAVPSHRDG